MPAKSSSSGEATADLDPLVIYFTFSRIRPRFSCGRTIESTLQQFRNGELSPRDLPLLSVLTDGTHYFSQNNRRLYTYKQLKREGLLDVVPVRLRPFPQTKRMQNKYTPQTCALTATLMRDTERDGGSAGVAAAAQSGDAPREEDASHKDEMEKDAEEEEEEEKIIDGEVTDHKGRKAAAGASRRRDDTQKEALNDDSSAGLAEKADGLSRKQKKAVQKSKKTQQRGGKGRRRGGEDSDSDSNSVDGGAGGLSALEAELRKMGLQ